MQALARPLPQVSVLFTEAGSVYADLGADCWPIERDARRWPGGHPIVAHPPCRAWSQMSPFAKPPPGERRLAVWSVLQIRRWGGVLEHPAQSKLWPCMGLPRPGDPPDRWGGWTLPIDQFWFGHLCRKRTFLYVVGCAPADVPPLPLVLGTPRFTMGMTPRQWRKPGVRAIPRALRASTPPELAVWLLDLAARCRL